MKTINFGIFAHVDAGKTTLTERILYEAGSIRQVGSVDGGTAQTDFMEVEQRRKISVNAAAAEFEWNGVRFNLVDTPGHADFGAAAERSANAMDCAVVVISGVEGVQARTELICSQLAERKVPTIFFVNKLDRAGADLKAVTEDLAELEPNTLAMCASQNDGSAQTAVQSLLSDTAFDETIAEAAAMTNDECAEAYLSGELTAQMLQAALADAVADRALIPIFAGAAAIGIGVKELLDAMSRLFPAAETGDDQLAGVVFKVEHDKAVGRVAHVRLYSGSLAPRDVVSIGAAAPRKITQIRKFSGRKYRDIARLTGGDIGAVCGLDAKVGDILGDASLLPQMVPLSKPLLTVKATIADSDYVKLTEAIDELAHEEPLLAPVWVKEKRELTINVTGTIQLEVISEILEKRFGIAAQFGKPSVIYRETPVDTGFGFDAYTMPKPCWAVLKFLIEPLPIGSGVEYSSKVANNKIFYRYQSQVEQAIPTALRQGPCGWEVVDLRITLVDGEHHTIHTHPLDFIVATPMAIMNGLQAIGTKMLEPTLQFKLSAPEECAGKLIGEIINLRGTLGDSPLGRRGQIFLEGELPVSTASDFPLFVAKATGGRGILNTRFLRYRDCPQEFCEATEYRGISPLDRAKYILWVRHALENADMHL
ncbi:MAG: TetM/TetW/TetO/TetS family tetracycline resistance ribosomal protection protein [Ruminococcaceae bacterium]|nr:TetM/TetW/TetO/TetS family tetracycline resistance ribosomal protection protein [Oscillospiraceae bacterium]